MQESINRLLVLDTSYSLEAIRSRSLEDSVTCRDLGGFFDHVWTVHPFATLVTSESWTNRYGIPEHHTLATRHTFIEGKIGRFSWLRWLPSINFLLSQIDIAIRLIRLIRNQQINVIRAGDPLYLGLFGIFLSRIMGIPVVIRVGGNNDKVYETTGKPIMPMLFRKRWIEKKVERFVFKHAELVAGANQNNLNFAIANGARSECSTLFRYGNLIDRLHFTDPPSRDEGLSLLAKIEVEPRKFILYIGRLEVVKHPDDVLRVLAEVRRQGYLIQAVIVGDGRQHASLVRLASELGIGDQVVFCGNQDQRWLARVIPLAAVVVSPHTGRALAEAALGAVPIVAYDVDWQSELIISGVTGLLVPYMAWSKMAVAVEQFLKDKDFAIKMGKAVREQALEMLDPELLTTHERKTYFELLSRFKNKRKNKSDSGLDSSSSVYAQINQETET